MRIAQCTISMALLATALIVAPVHAEKSYGPGASDKEIKLGQTVSYSGALSVFGTIGRVEAAYFEMLNAAGGIDGRKVTLISLDDGYMPPRTVEQTRKLVGPLRRGAGPLTISAELPCPVPIESGKTARPTCDREYSRRQRPLR